MHVILIIIFLIITGANVYLNYFNDQSDEGDEPYNSIQEDELQMIKLLTEAEQVDATKYAFMLSKKV